jgi:glycerol-1-phosphate dehydrogenase [NAD(P)+]
MNAADPDTFHKWKSMELPRSIVIGHAAIEETGRVCSRLKLGRKGLLVEDNTTRKIAGEKVAGVLVETGMDAEHHIIKDATLEEVSAVEELISDQSIDFVLGVGGGRPIDVAKCSSFNRGVPFLSVPTAASHDGLVSSRASLMGTEGKASIAAHAPVAVIMDTEIIAASPHRLLAAGCGDIIANSTAVKDWILAHNLRNEDYSSYAASLSQMTAQMMIDNADDIKPGLEESAWFVCKALVSSGVAMSIAGSSRPASGSEHLFSHALDKIAKKPALHGEQCGVGTIMMMYLHGGDWQRIREALREIGAPTTAKEMNISPDDVIEALVHAHRVRPDRYTILGDRGLTYEAAERLATITEVV